MSRIRTGVPLLLGDVADVVIGSPPPIGDAIINDVPGILLIVEKQPWANTLDVTRGVEAAMQQLAPALPGIDVDTRIFRPATFIERALTNLTHSLLIGCVLVIVVLALFLFNWRAAVISSLAIPLSLTAAVLVLYYRGGTINTMVLAGLIIALGEVVDDAIIDVENILRRLRLNHEAGNPKSAFQVVLDASLEVRSAVVYATLIVVMTLIPVFFLEGLGGLLLSAAGRLLHSGDSRFVAGGADGHTSAVVVVVAKYRVGTATRIAADGDPETMVHGDAAAADSASGCGDRRLGSWSSSLPG